MRTYLIDTENISSAWLPMLKTLGKGDKLVLFYTEFTCVLPYSALDTILTKSKQVKTIECERSGKNSLDFQLVSYLGYMLHKNDKNEYIIISNDKGFWSVASFWSKKGCHVECWSVEQLQQYITIRTLPDPSTYDTQADDTSDSASEPEPEPEPAPETQSDPVPNAQAIAMFNNNTTDTSDSNKDSTTAYNEQKKKNKTIKLADPVRRTQPPDEVTQTLFNQLNEVPTKFQKDNKYKSLSIGTKLQIARQAYDILKSRCDKLPVIVVAKAAVIMCFNKDINQISTTLSYYGLPAKHLMPGIKQCVGNIRRKIKAHKKEKKNSVHSLVMRQAALVLKNNGIAPPDAEMFANMIANSTKLSALITQIKQHTNAKTSRLIISVLPECYAA